MRQHAADAADTRYASVMRRHRERMQLLERERGRLVGVAPQDLDEHEARRERAAACIQAAWRGALQRRRRQLEGCAPLASRQSIDAHGHAPLRSRSPMLPADQDPAGGSAAAAAAAASASAPAAAAASSGAWRRVNHTSAARYQELMRQVERRIATRAQAARLGLRAGHAGGAAGRAPAGGLATSLSSDVASGIGNDGSSGSGGGSGGGGDAVGRKLQEMMEEREAGRGERLAAVRRRQETLQESVGAYEFTIGA
jgi:hypothetical protein